MLVCLGIISSSRRKRLIWVVNMSLIPYRLPERSSSTGEHVTAKTEIKYPGNSYYRLKVFSHLKRLSWRQLDFFFSSWRYFISHMTDVFGYGSENLYTAFHSSRMLDMGVMLLPNWAHSSSKVGKNKAWLVLLFRKVEPFMHHKQYSAVLVFWA